MNQPSRRHHRCALADYLAYEDRANVKQEFLDRDRDRRDGGRDPDHAFLAAAVTPLIGLGTTDPRRG